MGPKPRLMCGCRDVGVNPTSDLACVAGGGPLTSQTPSFLASDVHLYFFTLW